MVITDTSDSSAGSMFQVKWSFCAQVAPASSSVESRPPEATDPESSEVASVFEHAPCCGVSTSGHTHAALSGSAPPLPGQYGSSVWAVAWLVVAGEVASTLIG